MRKLSTIALLFLLLAGGWWLLQGDATKQVAPVSTPSAGASPEAAGQSPLPAFLPVEARDTLALIARGGPFPYSQDGGVFGNREKLLPEKARGYYREYTVYTPGIGHRGARRIVTGGEPPEMFYYTDDHYDSFRSFQVAR
ncbi:MAG: ribonuclease domain-containing protein [Pseudoxanthomonas sp.]